MAAGGFVCRQPRPGPRIVKLGIDVDPIGRNGSGNETYLRGIVRGLQRRAGRQHTFVLAGSKVAALTEFSDDRTRVVPVPAGLAGDLVLGSRLRRAGADIAVGNYNAPIGFRGTIATIIHDIAYARVPETFPFALRKRVAWSVARSVRVSDLVVTSSQFSRAELCELHPSLDPARVVVTYSAPGPQFLEPPTLTALADARARYQLPGTFVLAVGNIQPRKNLVRLARAVGPLGVPLMVVGQSLWKENEVLRDLGAPHVRLLGRVPIADLACLYRVCAVFVYPSLYEGFGLPVIEAMASGAPVVTSAGSSLREVAGDAAVLVDPLDVEDIARSVARILEDDDHAAALRERGRRRAGDFSWDASAETLLGALEAVHDGKGLIGA